MLVISTEVQISRVCASHKLAAINTDWNTAAVVAMHGAARMEVNSNYHCCVSKNCDQFIATTSNIHHVMLASHPFSVNLWWWLSNNMTWCCEYMFTSKLLPDFGRESYVSTLDHHACITLRHLTERWRSGSTYPHLVVVVEGQQWPVVQKELGGCCHKHILDGRGQVQ